MASSFPSLLSNLDISAPHPDLGLHQQDSGTCSSCNELLVNESSRTSILNSKTYFKYIRDIRELKVAASSGCILCQQLLDRHKELGPTDASDNSCPPDCQWSILSRDNSQLEFIIQSVKDDRHKAGELRYLKVSGLRKANERHILGDNAHFWHIVYDVTTDDETLLKSLVPARIPERNVASTENYEHAREWIHECLDKHKECQRELDPCLPSRVIDVSNVDMDPKLHISAPNERGQYIALSYCWGGPQTSQSTLENLEAYKSGLSFRSLPQTLKDAIVVTRELGIEYLWIDSICIIQDDEEDKLNELSRMGLIYQDAILTISAASAAACSEGFLNIRSHPRFPVKLNASDPTFSFFTLQYGTSNDKSSLITLTPNLINKLDVITDPIIDRAWTFQESLLSTRLLIYSGTQLLWRCKTTFNRSGGLLPWALYAENAPVLALTESFPIDNDRKYSLSLMPAREIICFGDDTYDISLENYDENYVDPGAVRFPKVWTEWLKIVSIYSRRQMTNSDDIFPAIAGIAEEVHRVTGETYCAGLWLEHFIVGLAWRRSMSPELKPSTRVKIWRAPSWSWASLDSAAVYDTTHHHWAFMKPLANVKDVGINRDPRTTRYGRILGGWVTVEGSLIPVEIEPLLEPVLTTSGVERMSVSQWADVFIGDLILINGPDGSLLRVVRRWGTAILDESITALPFRWTGGPLYAFDLFGSGHWRRGPDPERRLRFHGLLITKLPDGTFMRVGWFNTFAHTREEAASRYSKEEWRIIKLI